MSVKKIPGAVSRVSGAEAAVSALIDHGVDTVFGLPGIQLDPLFCALHDAGDALRVIHFRHEQGAAYAALGYAQASGRVGVYSVVPGPGFLNTTAALSTAYACGAPVLALIGQIETASIGRGLGELHEIPDQTGVMRGLTKWNCRVSHPHEIPGAVHEAFRHARGGRTRPVGIEIPPDVLALKAPVGPAPMVDAEQQVAPEVDPDAIAQAAQVLANATAPLIFAGGGALEAASLIEALAHRLQAPVATHRQGRGLIATDSPYALNLHEASRLWRAADVILAIGTRLHLPRKLWGLRPGQTLIQVDVDRAQVLAGGKPDITIFGSAREAVAQLLGELERTGAARASIAQDLQALKQASAAEFERRIGPQMAYVRALRAALPEEAIIVADYTQIAYVATAAFRLPAPRHLLTPGYQGTLGFGYATALGAQVAFPDRPVVALCGDGGFLFTATEMASAIQHGINVIAVVFNDNAFTNVQRMQRNLYDGKVIATNLQNPDFASLASSFGVPASKVQDPAGLEAALRAAVAARTPALIEVATDPNFPDPWPLLAPRLS